jgi:hypothetical protein
MVECEMMDLARKNPKYAKMKMGKNIKTGS